MHLQHRHILILCFFFLLSFIGESRHIIGGYSYYEHVQGDIYRVTMEMYRDCNDNGALFDDLAIIGVFYRRDQNAPYSLRDVRTEPIVFQERIALNRKACIDYPSDTCVERGIYRFEVELSDDQGDYIFAYQRCCRNNGVANIIYPPCGVGSTFYTEITERARQINNNSPTFNEFPPIVICSDLFFEYDHSAFDQDGDLLTYSFCAPKSGGGYGGSSENPGGCGGAFDPTGVRPNPPTTPPYANVQFASEYSSVQPIPGNPPLSINQTTGRITGFPDRNGLYTVGVCIDEFRNGEKIGSYVRDFQFYVTDCDPTVVGRVQGAIINQDGELVINKCGEKNVFLRNNSSSREDIFSVRWEVQDENGPRSFDDWDLTVVFDDFGSYTINLFLNEGEVCADTTSIQLNLFPSINADFTADVDSCNISPVDFVSLSESLAGPLTLVEWQFGDGSLGNGDTISHFYAQAGLYDVSLTVRDDNNCEDTRTIAVPYYPSPVEVAVSPNIVRGCAPQPVLFDNLTDIINEDYQVVWDFGDGTLDTALSPVHVYEEPGTYSVSVDITSPIGCTVSRQFGRLLSVNPSPTAAFDYEPKLLDRFNRTVQFENLSIEQEDNLWTFGRGELIYQENPVHSFRDTGFHTVQLIVNNEFNCFDTAYAILDIYPTVTHFLPNAFTPNADGTNDLYSAQGVFEGIQDYQLQIFDRYGQLVHESKDPRMRWDGFNMNNGEPVSQGSYMVRLQFKDARGKYFGEKSMLTIYR